MGHEAEQGQVLGTSSYAGHARQLDSSACIHRAQPLQVYNLSGDGVSYLYFEFVSIAISVSSLPLNTAGLWECLYV